MSNQAPDNKRNIRTTLFSIFDQVRSLMEENRSTQPRFLSDYSSVNFLPILDDEDMQTFKNRAVKTWRMYHPTKRGRRSEERLIVETCLVLMEKGQISEKSPLAKICRTVKASLEQKRQEDGNATVPHEDTIYAHVKEWKKHIKEMMDKGLQFADMRKALSKLEKGRPYNNMGPFLSFVKKKR